MTSQRWTWTRTGKWEGRRDAGWPSSGGAPFLKRLQRGRPTWTSCLPRSSGKPTSWPCRARKVEGAALYYDWFTNLFGAFSLVQRFCGRFSLVVLYFWSWLAQINWSFWLARNITLKLFDWLKFILKLFDWLLLWYLELLELLWN